MDAMSAVNMIRGVQSAFQVLSILKLTDFMYPPQANVRNYLTYDIIVIGGGTAGCVVASRLAEDGCTQVLLIEAGGYPPFESTLPALLVYQKNSSIDWKYTAEETVPQESCEKPSPEILSLGKVLGGTSTLNYLIYSEGGKKDYDTWADIANDSSWDGDSVLPYFIKSQALKDPIIQESEDRDFYGYDGPIILTKDRTKDAEDYLNAFDQAGFEVRESTNIENPIGFSSAMFNIGNGVRQGTANTYIIPQKNSTNFHLLTNALVTKIIFDNDKRAVAVEIIVNYQKIIVQAKLEIVLSAGAINSPKILMFSGIGPKKELKRNNIEVISDLPVGKNLQYQSSTILVFRFKNTQGKPAAMDPGLYPAPVIVGYAALNESSEQPDYLSINYINYASSLPLYSQLTYQFPDDITNDLFAPCGKYRSSDEYQFMFSVLSSLNMKTRGAVTLNSTDFDDQPNINLSKKYYSSDLDDQVKYIEDFFKIVDTPSFKKMGGEFLAPNLEECDDFELYSTEYWTCYAKCLRSVRPLFGGTTALGSVVDSRLRVKGVQGLRVVDAGIMPVLARAVLLGPTVMIAEKAADMIKEDNGL